MNRLHSVLITGLLLGASLAQDHVCTVTAAGESCAQLTVTLTPQGSTGNSDLTLVATGLSPRSAGGMIWGMNQVNLPVLFGSSCLLLTDYVWGHSFQTDAAGGYEWSRAWPAWFHGYFYMQMGSIAFDGDGALVVKTTSCKLARCVLP